MFKKTKLQQPTNTQRQNPNNEIPINHMIDRLNLKENENPGAPQYRGGIGQAQQPDFPQMRPIPQYVNEAPEVIHDMNIQNNRSEQPEYGPDILRLLQSFTHQLNRMEKSCTKNFQRQEEAMNLIYEKLNETQKETNVVQGQIRSIDHNISSLHQMLNKGHNVNQPLVKVYQQEQVNNKQNSIPPNPAQAPQEEHKIQIVIPQNPILEFCNQKVTFGYPAVLLEKLISESMKDDNGIGLYYQHAKATANQPSCSLENIRWEKVTQTDFYFEAKMYQSQNEKPISKGKNELSNFVNGYLTEVPSGNDQEYFFIPSPKRAQNSHENVSSDVIKKIQSTLSLDDQSDFFKGLVEIQSNISPIFIYKQKVKTLIKVKLILKTHNQITQEHMDEMKNIELELNKPIVVPLGEYYYSYEPKKQQFEEFKLQKNQQLQTYLNATFFLFCNEQPCNNDKIWGKIQSSSKSQFMIFGQIANEQLLFLINQEKLDSNMIPPSSNGKIPCDMFEDSMNVHQQSAITFANKYMFDENCFQNENQFIANIQNLVNSNYMTLYHVASQENDKNVQTSKILKCYKMRQVKDENELHMILSQI